MKNNKIKYIKNKVCPTTDISARKNTNDLTHFMIRCYKTKSLHHDV